MEISLHILDIAENAIASGSRLLEIELEESGSEYRVTVRDDGCGMTECELGMCLLEGYTTKEHGMGLGLPKFMRAAEGCGGTFSISSTTDGGTTVAATFPKADGVVLGDMTGAVCAVISGIGDGDVVFTHDIAEDGRVGRVGLDTRAERRVLGGVSISTPEVILFLREYIEGQYKTQYNIIEGEKI